MNILPFVSIFVLVIALFSFSFSERTKTLQYSELCYLGHLRSLRDAIKEEQEHLFSKIKEPSPKASKDAPKNQDSKKNNAPSSTPPSNKPYTSPRLKEPLSENRRLNVTPLFEETNSPAQNKTIIATVAHLIDLLYGHAPFFQEASERVPALSKGLAHAMFTSGKKHLQQKKLPPLALTDLFPQDPFLREIYYKMLQGTLSYNVTKQQGYPPFGDFIFLYPGDKRKAICFKTASIPLLQATFGEKITKEILKREEAKHSVKNKEKKASSTLTKPELEEILASSSLASMSEQYLALLQFTNAHNLRNEARGKDLKTGIVTVHYLPKDDDGALQ